MRLPPVRSLLLAAALACGCSRPAPAPSPASSASADARPRYGAVMLEIGRRFELAGRAAAAGRVELAAFEVGELGELVDDDLPRAELPKEGPTALLAGKADAFARAVVPDLLGAAKGREPGAFAAAFARTAAACNDCHQASGHGFVEVPSAPGKPVPAMDPVGAQP